MHSPVELRFPVEQAVATIFPPYVRPPYKLYVHSPAAAQLCWPASAFSQASDARPSDRSAAAHTSATACVTSGAAAVHDSPTMPTHTDGVAQTPLTVSIVCAVERMLQLSQNYDTRCDARMVPRTGLPAIHWGPDRYKMSH